MCEDCQGGWEYPPFEVDPTLLKKFMNEIGLKFEWPLPPLTVEQAQRLNEGDTIYSRLEIGQDNKPMPYWIEGGESISGKIRLWIDNIYNRHGMIEVIEDSFGDFSLETMPEEDG
jgi:hypothetical protein